MVAMTLPIFSQSIYAEAPPPVSAGARGGALELGVSAGFTDGWGTLGTSETGSTRIPGGGIALELDPSWRALPLLAIGVYGFGAQLTDVAALPSSGDVIQAGAGIQGTVHLRPTAPRLDPWISLGSGWRGQWLSYQAGSSTVQNGWELVRARAGLDSRITPGLALGPVIGGSLSRYYAQEPLPGPWLTVNEDPGLNVYVFAGVRATLDWPTRPPASHATP
jgi:hypothetical protein